MTDLSAALAKPEVGGAFESVVSLMIQATTHADKAAAMSAGYQFGRLHELCGNRPEDKDTLMALIREAAMDTVKKIHSPGGKSDA